MEQRHDHYGEWATPPLLSELEETAGRLGVALDRLEDWLIRFEQLEPLDERMAGQTA